MYSNLTGSFTENANLFNYKKILKSNLYYSLFNRKDDLNSILSWGESVLIRLEDNPFVYNDELIIYNYNTNYRFKVLKSLNNWILVNMLDESSTINFVKFCNELSTKEYFVTNNIYKRPIAQALTTNAYNYLNVEMRSLDTISTYPDFGNLVLKVDDIGTIICYNLSFSFFINFTKNKFESLSFDLCHKNDNYIPIIRNLKFKELTKDSIVFEFYTNNSKQYVVFTTKLFEINYSVYPDTFYDINTFISLSNDYKVHQQYSNYLNDLDIANSLQPNTLINIPSDKIFYCKEYFGGENIEYYTYSDVNYTTCYTLVNNTNICYSSNSLITSRYKSGDKIKISSTIYTIQNITAENIDTVAITLDSNISTAGTYNIIINDYNKNSVTLNNVDFYYSENGNSDKFIVDAVTCTNGISTISTNKDLRQYFTNDDIIYLINVESGIEIESEILSITENLITLTANYSGDTGNTIIKAVYFKPFSSIDLIFKTYQKRLYGYTSTESIAKKYALTNLMVTFKNDTSQTFRQLALFYGNSSNVPVYLSENKLITIFNPETMNFVIIL